MIIDRGQARSPIAYKAASCDWIFTIILIGYEAELHSTAGRARWGGGVPERCAASELSQGSRGARGDAIGDQPGIRALEARVGAALFIRTTPSVGLTEAGERFHSRAKPAFEELVAASEVARDFGTRPAGLLRLSVPRSRP